MEIVKSHAKFEMNKVEFDANSDFGGLYLYV